MSLDTAEDDKVDLLELKRRVEDDVCDDAIYCTLWSSVSHSQLSDFFAVTPR